MFDRKTRPLAPRDRALEFKQFYNSNNFIIHGWPPVTAIVIDFILAPERITLEHFWKQIWNQQSRLSKTGYPNIKSETPTKRPLKDLKLCLSNRSSSISPSSFHVGGNSHLSLNSWYCSKILPRIFSIFEINRVFPLFRMSDVAIISAHFAINFPGLFKISSSSVAKISVESFNLKHLWNWLKNGFLTAYLNKKDKK